MAIMARIDIAVGDKPMARKAASVAVEELAERADTLKKHRPKVCGAMSQQRRDSSAQSLPQKFVRLVGCRDPKARPSRGR
jgi:hypothetical protein